MEFEGETNKKNEGKGIKDTRLEDERRKVSKGKKNEGITERGSGRRCANTCGKRRRE